MDVRFDFQSKKTLVERYETLLGPDFLADLAAFNSTHDCPDGVELLVQWHGVNVSAVMFGDSLLLLRICKKKSDTPDSLITVGEVNFYPAKEIKPVPEKRM